MNKLCMLLTFCLWCVMSYAGQDDPQVKGRLIDAESGAAIDFADVFLCSESTFVEVFSYICGVNQ